MLGKVRRTTRTDVGLAIALTGVAYLVWVLAIGVARHIVNALVGSARIAGWDLPTMTRWLCNSFLYGWPVWNVAGVLWLLVGLMLIVGASRQRWSISWAWMSAICQTMAATLLAVWAALGGYAPSACMCGGIADQPGGWTFLSVSVAVALVLWVTVLVWLLYERARLERGPSLRDSLHTHRP